MNEIDIKQKIFDKELKKNKKKTIPRKCYNCKFKGFSKKFYKITYIFCEEPSQEEFRKEHPFNAINTFSYSCENHKFPIEK